MGIVSIYTDLSSLQFINSDFVGLILGLILVLSSLIAGIGLIRVKKYSFISLLVADTALIILAIMNGAMNLSNIFLIGAILYILASIYLYFEKEKLK